MRHLITAAVVLCVLCLTCGLACGNAAAITVDPDKMVVLMDENALQRLPVNAVPKGATLAQIIDHRGFATVTAASLPATLTDVWYRIPLANHRDTPVQIVFDFAEMLHDEIEFHTNVDGSWKSTLTGLKYPYYSRALDYPYFAFPLELPAHYDGYIYFRLNSAHPASVCPVVYGPQRFHQEFLSSHGTSLLLIGILAGVIMIMSMIIVTLREMRLFALLALLGGMLFNIAYSNGFVYKLIADQPELHRSLYIYGASFTNIMLSQLCIGLFDLRRSRPFFYGFLLLLQLLCVALSAVTLFQDPAPYIQMINLVMILTVLLALVVGIDAQIRKAQSAALFNAGLTSWLVVTLYTILGVNGAVRFDFWSRHAYEAGLLVLCVFFSLTLIDRMRYYRQQHDTLLQKAAVAETREQLKSEFLAAMSHEIRTPINGVLGMAQMLTHTEQSPTQRYYTDIIIASGRTLLNVLNDILDLSKVEAGKLRLIKESVDLGQLVTYASTVTSSFPEKSGIRYQYRIDPAVSVFVQSDNSRLQQILTNLLTNAFKFTDQGSIRFSVDLAADQSSVPDGNVALRFSVSDTGVGIAQEQCKELFKPYMQVELRQPSRYRGTGLGLSICKRLVELMQGRIGVNSTLGCGSEFWFEIPAPIDITRQREYESKVSHLRNKHLVIANLAQHHTQLLTEHFNYFGMKVTHIDVTTPSDIPDCDILVWMPAANSPDITQVASYCTQKDLPAILLVPAGTANGTLEAELPAHIACLLVPAGITEFVAALHSAIVRKKRDAIQQSTTAISGRSQTVLVAEDNLVNQKIIIAMLNRLGARHALATNGKEAFELFKQTRNFDLVLLDCEMPVMDGYETARVIRQWEKDHALKPLPVIALTAHALPEHFERCMAAGMDKVLTKPLDINDLAATLAELPNTRTKKNT